MAVPIPNHPVEEKETLADLHLDWAKHLIEHATEIRESFDQIIEIEIDGKESHVVTR